MSTLPGGESWRDAGLVEPDVDEVVRISPSSADDEPEDYDPEPEVAVGTTEASEADVVEQRAEVPQDDQEDYR